MPRSAFGSPCSACVRLGLGLWVLLAVVAPADAGSGAVAVQGTASDFFDRAAGDYDGGPGLNLFGLYRLNANFDVRADVGARFLEGDGRLKRAPGTGPELGARVGELTESARVIPFTVGLVYRFEQLSKGRFWLPYASVGLGFYDVHLTYIGADEATLAELEQSGQSESHDGEARPVIAGEERSHDLYEFGWTGKLGVHLYRTSGMFVNVESGLHALQTEERWQPMWDVAIGVGTVLPLE